MQHHVLNADVLRLLDQAACAHPDVDPTRFDAHYWSERARETVATYCHKCPAIASCATVILGPAKHASFTGIASGLVWRAGKPVRQPLKRRRKKQ